MGQLIFDPKTGKYVDAYDLKKAKDAGSMSREAYNAAVTYKAPNPALAGTTVNRAGQRVNEAGQVLGATERRPSLAPNNTITRFQNEPDYYAGNERLRQRVKDIEEQTPDGMSYLEFVQGGGKVKSTYVGGQSVRDNAQALVNMEVSGGEDRLADMMRTIKEQQKKLGQTIKSEGTANNMNAAGQGASFGMEEDDAGSLVDAVTAERNEFFGVNKQRELLKKQLGLQKEEGEDARNQLIRERDQQLQELQQQQATAKRDAVNLYFGGQDAPMNTTVAGIGESRAAQYDKLIRNVQDASADQLRQLDRDIRSGNLEAEALLMDFDLQERTAIVNEVQRRLNTRSQSAIAQIEYLKEAGALTETAPEVLKSIAQAGGINYGTLLALQAVEKQAESISMASYADLSARMETGEATAEEAKQFYELDKLQSEAMKLRRELEPVDNIVNGVNFTKLTEAADLAKKLKESGASADTINTVLQASGASIAAGADIDFDRVEKVIATARMMNDYLSPDDVKGFLDGSLQALGFQADVMITQDPMLGLKMQEQEINNLLKKRELNGYLSPIEQAQLEGLLIDNETKWQELSGGGGGMSGGGSGNWQVIPGSGKTRADRNNNPGNLRAGGNTDSGGFTIFATAQEGFQAMINDVTAKLTGNSPAVRSKLGRNAQTLRDVISVYAPKEDNNNPNNYANVVAKQLGISPDAPVGSLINRVPELAAAMAKHEGYSGSFVFGGGATEKDAVLAQIQSGRITPSEISDVRKQAEKQGWLSEFTRAITEPKNQIISPKTAETFKTDIAMTGRQLDQLVREREQMGFGNSTFQRLPQDEYDKLRSLIASGSRAQDALALYDKLAARSVGGATGANMALFRAAQNRFGKQTEESQMYNELSRLVGVELSEYIKNISGAAVSEQEAQRLKKNVPNLDMPDSTFRKALQDFIAQKNAIAEAKARSFGFRNADEFASRLSDLNFPTQPTGAVDDAELLQSIMNDPSENLGFDIKGLVSNVFNAFRR